MLGDVIQLCNALHDHVRPASSVLSVDLYMLGAYPLFMMPVRGRALFQHVLEVCEVFFSGIVVKKSILVVDLYSGILGLEVHVVTLVFSVSYLHEVLSGASFLSIIEEACFQHVVVSSKDLCLLNLLSEDEVLLILSKFIGQIIVSSLLHEALVDHCVQLLNTVEL